MLLEQAEDPAGFLEDEALLEEFLSLTEVVKEEIAQLENLTSDMLKQYRADIQSWLNYTVCLQDTVRNPFAKALDFPLHPRMNLI